jgi:DNA adenine methylase
VNSRGEFNVPLGSYKNPLICDEENLLLVQRKLKNIRLLAGNYRKIAAGAKQGDFVYFDPPYAPLSTSSSFVNYAKDGFSREDQAELCDFFKELTSRGVLCMLSNSSAPLIFRLYQGFHIERVKASRPVNSQPGGRGKIEELIITNY